MRSHMFLHLRPSIQTRLFPLIYPSKSSLQSYRVRQYLRHSSTDGPSTSQEATTTDKRTTIANPTTAPVDPVPTQAVSPRFNPLVATYKAYNRSQAQHPYWTQIFSSLAIYLIADISAQTLSTQEDSNEDTGWDVQRTARNLVIGGIAAIPGYKWFMFLSRNFNYTSSLRSITTKVVVNQIIWAPGFNTYYFGMSCLLSGGSVEQIIQRLKDTVPTSVYNSLFVWPWFQAFNFTFVQAEMRAISSALFAIGWQAYLSWLNKYAETRRRTAGMVRTEKVSNPEAKQGNK